MASVEIRPFAGAEAPAAEQAAWADCCNRVEAVAWPEDPPAPLAAFARRWTTTPSFVAERRWAAWNGEGTSILGLGSVTIARTPENAHVATFRVLVRPEARGRGIGGALLRLAVEAAREEGRGLLLAYTEEDDPDGARFMRRFGARPGLVERSSQLELPVADPALLARWRGLAPEFLLGWWIGPYPEEAYEEVAAMKHAVNLMPREELEIEDDRITVEQLREWEAAVRADPATRWCLYARDPESGEIAGYTQLWWSPENPELFVQDDTAVFPRFQKRGLGRRLKAEMLARAAVERPQARRVRTWNAKSNAPMLRINIEMGFRPRQENTAWQVERERVEALLGRP